VVSRIRKQFATERADLRAVGSSTLEAGDGAERESSDGGDASDGE
jgi:hypothetical protein